MLDSEQVSYVARLARLELNEEEVAKFAAELSSVLDHIEKINELDLKDVEPTSHAVAVENVLRSDEPRPSLPVEKIISQAPAATEIGFEVPSPTA